MQVSGHTVAAALSVSARVRDWLGAIELYEQARESGVAPTPHTLNAALGACVNEPSLGWRRAVR